jgi:hypothetical protein
LLVWCPERILSYSVRAELVEASVNQAKESFDKLRTNGKKRDLG